MTKEELIKAWVAYRGEANVTNDQLQAIKWAWETLQMDEKKIDWEQRRYEIAKTMLPCLTTIRYNASADGDVDFSFCVRDAVICADMLIDELKSHKHNDN